jgi:aminopeptidase N
MPTYLVAMVVSDYSCRKTIAHPILSKNVDVGVCARPNAYDQLDLAYNASVELLEFFEQYYNIAYPLSKLGNLIDLILNIIR